MKQSTKIPLYLEGFWFRNAQVLMLQLRRHRLKWIRNVDDQSVTDKNDPHHFNQPPSPTATNEDNSESSHTGISSSEEDVAVVEPKITRALLVLEVVLVVVMLLFPIMEFVVKKSGVSKRRQTL